MSSPPPTLLRRAVEASGQKQADLAEAMGISRRTLLRYLEMRDPRLRPQAYHALAAQVLPHDLDLAAEVAAAGGTTLEALGLVKRPAQSAPSRAVAPRAALPGAVMDGALVDAVVCAAAEHLEISPRVARPALAAAFARAQSLGLTVETLARALATTPPPA